MKTMEMRSTSRGLLPALPVLPIRQPSGRAGIKRVVAFAAAAVELAPALDVSHI